MVITYNPGPLWSSPGLMLKRFYCSWGWDQGCLEGGCRRSWAKWRRLKGTEVVMQKFLSLRVEAFHNSIALTDHVVVSVAIIGRRNNFNKFSGWPGPGWSSPGISISLKHLDRHIFYRHKLLTFLDTVGMRARQPLRSQIPTGTFTLRSAPSSGCYGQVWSIQGPVRYC